MNRLTLSLVVFMLAYFSTLQAQVIRQSEKLSTRLIKALSEHPQSQHKVLILLKDHVDMAAMDEIFYQKQASLYERTYTVITTLKARAAATQPPILAMLAGSMGVNQGATRAYWITNLIGAHVTTNVVDALSMREDIESIDLDVEVMLEPFHKGSPSTRSVGGHEVGLEAIHAPFMWGLGYTGNGKIVMSIDTGGDPTHPAIDNQYHGNYFPAAQCWFDPGSGSTVAYDCDSHGTHTIGTMVGLDANTADTIGVAFGATWIGSPGICAAGDRIGAFQWSIDPDANPNTIEDMPVSINNSWYDPDVTDECSASNAYKLALDACEAAGIAVVFSAGNAGPNANTITMPKNISTSLVNVFSVGNINANNASLPIAGSSSRGPSNCGGTGSFLIKPEVSAPGTDVRSCVPGGAYDFYTGTSMAAPHAAGAIALLKEAFPLLTGTQIKLALYYSATDLGAVGEDNDYGMGIIDLEGAYNYLVNQGNVAVVPNNNNNAALSNLQNVNSLVCGTSISPSFTFGNNGTLPISSATIKYTVSGGAINSQPWTGSLAVGANTTINLNPITVTTGAQNIHIWAENPNGQPDAAFVDNHIFYNFNVSNQQPVSTTGANVCISGSATITATPSGQSTIVWYSTPTGGTPLDSGNTYTTPVLATTTTYYADNIETANTGILDNTQGTGSNHTNDSRYQFLDVYKPFTLNEVTIYSNQAGNRTIQIRDNAGNVLNQVVVNVPTGEQRVTLNLPIPIGTGLQLGISGLSEMYRTSSGTNYPYTVPNVVSITGSNGGSDYYYYFYDWLISWGNPCGRAATVVNVNPNGLNVNAVASNTNVDLFVSGNVDFTGTGTNVNTWSWNFGDGTSSTLQNPSHVYTNVGAYNVIVNALDNNNCSDTDTILIQVSNTNSISSQLGIGTVQIQPNPHTNRFDLQFNLNGKHQAAIQLFDPTGREIISIPTNMYYQESISFDTSPYTSGIYFIKVTFDEGVWTQKIIKE